ncbi:MAG: hypothetical protein AAGC92_05620 [Pseudomonadota bacterium]
MSATPNPPPANVLAGTLEAYYANLQRTDDNVEAIEQGINNAYIATAVARASIQAVETIRDDAKQLSVTVDTFKFVAKLMSKAGGLKPVGTVLTKILEKVDTTVEKIEKKAEEVDKKFKDKNLVEKLQSVETKLDRAGDNLGTVSKVLDVRELQAAATIFALDSTAPYSNALATAVDLQVYADNLALEKINNFADPILQPVKDFNELVRVKIFDDFLDGVSELRNIAGVFDGVAGPLNELYKLLKPVESVLNAVGFVFDITVGWIIDWAFEALGINKLIDKVEEQINKLLPDIEILDRIDDAVDNIVEDVQRFADTVDFEAPDGTFIPDIRFNLSPNVPSIQTWINQIYTEGLAGFEDPDCGPILIGSPDDDTIVGYDDEDDILDGGAGNDLLRGLGGDDILIGGAGNDRLEGGTDRYSPTGNPDGGDRAIYRGGVEEFSVTQEVEGGPVIVSHVRPSAGTALQGTDTLTGIEYAVFNGAEFLIDDLLDLIQIAASGQTRLDGDDTQDDILIGLAGRAITMTGRGGDDRLIAGSGGAADALFGGDGNDYLDPAESRAGLGPTARDSVYGGSGVDTLSLRRNGAGEHVDLAAGRYLAAGEGADNSPSRLQSDRADIAISIENVVGTLFDDAIFGTSGINHLQGFDGNDLIDGRVGRDSLEGGKGNDLLVGGTQSDTAFGGEGNDVFIGARAVRGVSDLYDGGVGIDLVSYSALESARVPTSWRELPAYGPAALKIIGRADFGTVRQVDDRNQTIATDWLVEVEGIRGSLFNDLLIGGDVEATLDGAAGNDTIVTNGMTGVAIGGTGADTVFTSDRQVDYFGGSLNAPDDSIADVLDMTRTANLDWDITDSNGNGSAKFRVANDPNAFFSTNGSIANGFERYIFGAGDDTYFANTDGYRLISMGDGNDQANISANAGVSVTGVYLMGDGDDELSLFRPGTANMGPGADTLRYENFFNDGAATLIGGLGDDTFEITAGKDIYIDGGANGAEDRPGVDVNDTDWLTIKPTLSESVTVLLDKGRIIGAITGTFRSIEKVNGTSADDTLRGSDVDNQLMGADGGDRILGLDGSDNIYGGAGDDTIFGGAGADHIFGGTGSDEIYGGDDAHADTVSYSFFSPVGTVEESGFGDLEVDLDNGTVFLTWSSGSETENIVGIENVIGGVGNDSITGDEKANALSGGAGNDTLTGLAGDDVLSTGDGFDRAYGGSGNDTVNVGNGNFVVNGGVSGVDTLNLGELAGTITYDFATDRVRGTVETTEPVWADTGTSESRSGLTPQDVLEADPLFYNDIADADRIVPDTPSAQIVQTATTRNLNAFGREFERVQGGTATLTVRVTGDREVVIGGTESIEIVSFFNETRGVSYNLATGVGSSPFSANDAYRNVDGLEGSNESDVLIGNNAANTLYGGSGGNDALYGAGGNDVLSNLSGTSTLVGGAGDDLFVLGTGGDVVRGGGGTDRVEIRDTNGVSLGDSVFNLLSNVSTGQYGRDKRFVEIEEFAFLMAGAATIIGSAGGDVIELGGTNKVLRTLGGNDAVHLGEGISGFSLAGGSGIDTLDFSERTSDLTVSFNNGVIVDGSNRSRIEAFENVTGGAGNDRLIGANLRNIIDGGPGNDRILGVGSDDFLQGGADDDVIFGNTGNDVVIGGLGDDVLYGGGGADRFLFVTGDGNDLVRDYQDNFDKILIRGNVTFEDLTIADAGQHSVVSFDLNDITIQFIEPERLTASDFVFN